MIMYCIDNWTRRILGRKRRTSHPENPRPDTLAPASTPGTPMAPWAPLPSSSSPRPCSSRAISFASRAAGARGLTVLGFRPRAWEQYRKKDIPECMPCYPHQIYNRLMQWKRSWNALGLHEMHRHMDCGTHLKHGLLLPLLHCFDLILKS